MKIFECKCGSTDVFIEQQGNNCGLYCADCGKWITWLNKDSKRLAERQIKGIEKEIRNKAIEDFANSVKNLIADSCVIRNSDIDDIVEQLKERD